MCFFCTYNMSRNATKIDFNVVQVYNVYINEKLLKELLTYFEPGSGVKLTANMKNVERNTN